MTRAAAEPETINPGVERGYALDFHSVVRHVATELRGASAPLTVSDIAQNYRHVIGGDLSRVRRHHSLSSDRQATEFLIERALLALGKQVVRKEDGYQLARRKARLEYQGKLLTPTVISESTSLRDPFNPMSGQFSENFRSKRALARDDLSELRESMREFGWIPELPAIKDERDVVLVGHRRLAVAAELGIEPVVSRSFFGGGDAADARRFRIGIASNIGSKPLTPDERKGIAEYLYSEREWTMTRIAQALNVSQVAISGDLVNSSVGGKFTGRGGRPNKITPKQELSEQRKELMLQRVEAGESASQVARSMGYKSTSTALVAIDRAKAARYDRLQEAGKLVFDSSGPYQTRLVVPYPPAVLPTPPPEPGPDEPTTHICEACNGTGRVMIVASQTS